MDQLRIGRKPRPYVGGCGEWEGLVATRHHISPFFIPHPLARPPADVFFDDGPDEDAVPLTALRLEPSPEGREVRQTRPSPPPLRFQSPLRSFKCASFPNLFYSIKSGVTVS